MVGSLYITPAPSVRSLFPPWCLQFSQWAGLYLTSECPAYCACSSFPCRRPFPGSCDCQLSAELGQWEVLVGDGKAMRGRKAKSSSLSSMRWAASTAVTVYSPWLQLLPDHPALGHWKHHLRPAALGVEVASYVLCTWVLLWPWLLSSFMINIFHQISSMAKA